MRTEASRSAIGVGLALTCLLAACGDDRSFPTRPSPQNDPGTPAVRVTRLTVEGPGTIAPGESADFRATATFADGTLRDVTGESQWSSTDATVLSHEGSNRFVARVPGEAAAHVEFKGVTHSRQVVSLPRGLVLLRGRVSDATHPNPSIFGARVEVTRGDTAGATTTTGFDGGFVIYGVSPDTEIRVTKDGFASFARSLRAPETNFVAVSLLQTRERPDLRGTYRLTIGGGTCEGGAAFPDALRTRIYRAVLLQSDQSLLLDLKDTEFVTVGSYGDRMLGVLQMSDVTFDLGDFFPTWDWGGAPSYPTVVERLADGVLMLTGRIVADVTPTGMAGTYDGAIKLYDALPADDDHPRATCRSSAHRFVLER